MESLLFTHPNCSGSSLLSWKKKASNSSYSSPSQLFHAVARHRCYSISVPINGHELALFSQDPRRSWLRSVVAFASTDDESHSEIEVEKERDKREFESEESQEAWKQALDAFKEQALKMKSISQEAYEIYSKKASVILIEVSEELKIQADKARNDFTVIAREVAEEGKEYISTAAENSPEEIKDIVESFASSTDDLSQISKIQDFYLGIPYGLALCLGGFLSFMVTGSTAAIRFGVILGGSLLALSISSLRSQKSGKSFALALKGQTVIAAILFLREVRLLSQRPSFLSYLTAPISGAVVAFYLYRITLQGRDSKG